MDSLKELYRDKSPAHRLMLLALLVLTVSQFFLYETKSDNSYMSLGPNFSSTVYLDVSARNAATGWELHPHAYVILVALAFALLRDDLADTRWFDRFGYWLVVLLMFFAATPSAPFRAKGAAAGFIAILIAVAAATLHQLTRKTNISKPN
jgi:hypothetical protein